MHILSENILMFILSRRKSRGSWGALSGDSCDDALSQKDAQVVGLGVLGDPCQGVDFFGSCGLLLHCAGSLASQCVCP